MYEAMKQATAIDKAIVAHCEDNSLIYGGSVHEGHSPKRTVSMAFHLCVNRFILPAMYCWLKRQTAIIMYAISARKSLSESYAMRKSRNQSDSRSITASFLLCDEDIPGLDTNYKMNPPLRAQKTEPL